MTSIRRRLTLALCLGLGGLLAVGMGLLYAGLRHALQRQFDETLLARLHDVESDLRWGENPSVNPPHVGRHGRFVPRNEVVVIDPAGRVIASDASPDLPRFSVPENPHGGPVFWNLAFADGRPARAAAVMSRERSADGPVRLVVVSDRIGLEHALGAVLFGVTLVGFALLVVTVAIVLWMLHRGLRPLEGLSLEAARIDAGTLDRRFDVPRLPLELQPIAARLNDLLARLQRSFARERRVSADLAHELRTPLAELRVLAESALKWPESREPETDREVLAVATHMEALIGRMLLLARSEGDRLTLAQEPVDIAAVLGAVWRTFSARAAERGLSARLQLAPASTVADPALVRSVLGNLVENAVDYAAVPGEIALDCRQEGPGTVVIEISNTVSDLSQEDVSRFFERYWRKEAARSARGHFGLGLSLVRGFCDALGWMVTPRLEERGVLRMILRGGLSAAEASASPPGSSR